jgi:hypothetical protein
MTQETVKYYPGDLIEYYIQKYDQWYVGTYVISGYDHAKATTNPKQEWIGLYHQTQSNYHWIKTRNGKELQVHKLKIRLKYSFDQELTELLETGSIKHTEEKKENNKMAKFTTIGMIAKKKDGSGSYVKIDVDVSLKKGQYLTISKKPTEEQIEANPKLKQRADKWPDWKSADLVLVTDN